MEKLFMIGMGGSVGNATIEVHDMQFVIAENKEQAFEVVKQRWYGSSLHIDSYTEMKYINGYKIDLDSDSTQDLFMVVYGGYKKGYVDELHDYNFVLADSKVDAKQIGKDQMNEFENMDHVDNVVNIFEYLNTRFGLIKGEYSFKMNTINHIFIKLIK